MNFDVSFPKIKLTNRLRPISLSTKKRDPMTNNNSSLPPGYFYLTSFHKYWPRIKMIKHSANEDQETFFTFEETTFIAVTHYQNEEVNFLKKINNPHAKGFKGSSKDQNNPYISESENSDNVIESEVDDDNEVDIEEISDISEKNPSYHQTTASRSNGFIPLEQKVRQWRQDVNIESSSTSIEDNLESKVMRGSSNDDVFHTNQTNLYQNMGGFSPKVVKNAHYSSRKHLASHKQPEINCRSARSISISSRDFSNSEYNNSSANYSINPYKLSDSIDDSKYKIDYNATKKPKLDQSISFLEVQQNKQQEETQSWLISRQQLLQKNTQQSIWNNFSVPKTPLSPGNIFFSTIFNNDESSNFESSNSYVRLEQAKNENKRLREFIRERYGVEAEKEADAVVALGGKEL